MVKIGKIYTRSGDDGLTSLVGKPRVPKNCLRVDAYGEVDELNSHLGLSRTLAEKHPMPAIAAKLALIQNQLFDIGSLLATAPKEEWPNMPKITTKKIEQLENWIDELIEGLPELKSFVIPGGSELNACLHISRTVCRRVERRVLDLAQAEEIDKQIVIYLNRLSDLLFAMARYASKQSNTPEYLWQPGKE